MKKKELIARIVASYPDAFLVSSCGFITRELYNVSDRANHFYMVGSMGMAAPIALGLAISRPDQTFIVLDGDGSFAMNFGITLMIAEQAPKNLFHFVIDNGMHESTGGQASVPLVNYKNTALAIGYKEAFEVGQTEQLPPALTAGPALFHCVVEPGSDKIGKRVEWTPEQIVQRFTESLAEAKRTYESV